MKSMLFVLSLLLSTSPLVAASFSPVAPSHAAAQVRALAQTQAKLYLQMRFRIDTELAQTRLSESVKAFDAHVDSLNRAKLGGSAARALGQLNAIWVEARPLLAASFSADAITRVCLDAEQLALIAQRLAIQLESQEASPAYRLADLAMRNDMLSQRLARIYLQLRAGDGDPSRSVELAQTRKEFATSLNELLLSAQTSTRIASNLKLAKQQWYFFEEAVMSSKADPTLIRNVATSSERISEVMREIAQNYLHLERASETQNARIVSRWKEGF